MSLLSARAIQVDGGSEFQAEFETECQRRGIRLFVLAPRSPKLNGRVERAQRKHTEESYEVWDLPWPVGPPNRKLRAWEQIYNTVRPHQSLPACRRAGATGRRTSTSENLPARARPSNVPLMY